MAQTILDAVNQLLNAIGSASVPLISTAPDVVAAKTALEQVSKDVQRVGWYFNTEYFYYSLDEDGKQALPANVLKIDTFCTTLIKRGGYIYDKITHSNVLTGYSLDGIKYKMVLELGWDEIPPSAYGYIIALAKVKFVIEFEGDYQKAAAIKAGEAAQAYTDLRKEQFDTIETGYATNPQTARLMAGLPGVFTGRYT